MNRLSLHSFFQTPWIFRFQNRLSNCGLGVAFFAIFISLLNLVVSFQENGFTFPLFIFCLIFFLTLSSSKYGLTFYIFALPLIPGVLYQLSQFSGILIAGSDAVGFELTSGFVLALSLHYVWQKFVAKSSSYIAPCLPWQLSLVLIFIVSYGALTIARNLWQSAAVASIYGVYFNIAHLRSIGWHEDFRPLMDCFSFGLVGALLAFLIPILRSQRDGNSVVFRPILAALLLSSLWAIFQSSSGVGGGLGFRRDFLGIPAFGFQPDLHAFAGYMLLGVIGLFGYLKTVGEPFERRIIYLIIALSFVALVLSKSRSMLIIGLLALLILFFVNLWRRNRRNFYWAAGSLLLVIAMIGLAWYELAIFYKTDLGGFNKSPWGSLAKSSWIIQLALELSDRELSHFNEFSVALGGRPEFYRAALRILYFFPFLGVGIGSFYRNSIFEQLTASPTLRSLGGENTHNYFLQTLAETGLIGGIIFSMAILFPMLWAVRQKNSWPALFGLVGLFLGNVYAHSFLVRENFFLAAVLLALLYSTYSSKPKITPTCLIPGKLQGLGVFILFLLLIIITSREAFKSFDRYPFSYGQLCFIQNDLSNDGWSSGRFQVNLPGNTKNVTIFFDPLRPNIARYPLALDFEIIEDGVGILAKKSINVDQNGLQPIAIDFAGSSAAVSGDITANLRLSSCFTPKSLGGSFDARRLGLKIEKIKVTED